MSKVGKFQRCLKNLEDFALEAYHAAYEFLFSNNIFYIEEK